MDNETIGFVGDEAESTEVRAPRRLNFVNEEKKKSRLYGKKYLGFCFLAPAVVMLLIYVALGVFPISNGSVLVLDLNAQYVYFTEHLRDIILGNGSLLYSFGRALGGEFMGIFAYYLASPFNLITALFPKAYITEALLTIFVLKTGCCGLTFGIFLHGTREKRRPVANIIFSSMYALSAFAVVMQHNHMWIDNLICLPLIMLGVERIIKYGKYKTFVIFLALAVFSNFYIGYMTCIFTAIYFFVRYCSLTKEERNPRGERLHFLRTLLRMIFFSLIGVAIAAVVILTAYYSLSFGKLEFSTPDFKPKQLFDITDLVSKFYFGSYDTVRPEGSPFLFAGMLMTILAPLYFITPGIKKRRKVGAGILMAVFFVSFELSTADLIWHGFQRPNWLNARFAFMFVFVALVMAYEVFVRIGELGFGKVVASGVFSIALLIVLQKLGTANLPTFTGIWASIGIIGLYLAILPFTHRDASATSPGIAAVALAMVVCGELFAAGLANCDALGDDVIYSSRESYRTFIDPYLTAIETVDDDGFYRSEKIAHRKPNDNFTLGLYGLSNSTSTLNAKVINLLSDFGFTSKSHWSKYVGGTVTSDAFFGIKYIYINQNKNTVPTYISEYYDLLTTTEDGIMVFRNPYAFPLAFGVDDSMAEIDTADELEKSPFTLMNEVMAASTGKSDLKIWNKIVYTNKEYSGARQFGVQDNHTGYEKDSSETLAKVTYVLTAPDENPIYMYIASKWPKKSTLIVNGRTLGAYFTNDTHAAVELGSFEAGEEVRVEFTLSEEKFYLLNNDDYFYSFDKDAFAAVADKLVTSGLEITSFSEDRIEGGITLPEGGGLVMTTIPYDEGWHVYSDGKPVEYTEALGALIAFRLDGGTHEITMRYMPRCFVYGLAISLSGIAAFVLVCIADALIKRIRRKRAALAKLDDSLTVEPFPEFVPDVEIPVLDEETAEETAEDTAEETAEKTAEEETSDEISEDKE
ncbi:MAG: YfhO family protein [Clostridia bacterium]|nr:YfhO family protein [Clostridia bacterium]